jgi:hypothetical protein
MATTIYPNGTVQQQWNTTGTPSHAEIDEDPPDAGDHVHANGSASDNKIDIYSFPDTIDDVDEVTQIVVRVYLYSIDADVSPSADVGYIDIDLGGYQGQKTLNKPHNGLQTLTWAGLSGSQADMDGFELKLGVGTLNDGKYMDDSYTIYCIHVDVTYTPVAAGGWGHKFNGVAGASIGKISGVAIANVGKVKGV